MKSPAQRIPHLDDQTASLFYDLLHECFATGQGPVVLQSNGKTSYPDLYRLMLKVNAVLDGRQRGRVCVYGPKGHHTYAALYAIFLSNNTWVPLSSDIPSDRNASILRQVVPDLTLVVGPPPPFIAEYAAQHGMPVVDLRQVEQASNEVPFAPCTHHNDDLAYILFTSGSTGTPKGVPMTHVNYINFIRNCFDIFPFRDGEVFSDLHDFTFDLCIFYLFCAPFVGGALAPAVTTFDKCFPVPFIRTQGITIWSSVPSSIRQIMAMHGNDPVETPIHVMFLCGEPLPLPVVRYCFENMHLANVYNFYGLTETGVENYYHRLTPADVERFAPQGLAPIGQPLPGNSVRITPDKELLIGGCQITPGYLGGIESQRFFEQDGVRWFRTGDIVEEVDGLVVHKGRGDSQVKLHGHRIELLDIEAALRRHADVVDAVCLCIRDPAGDYLAAAYQPRPGVAVSQVTLMEFARSLLPSYMIPRTWHAFDSLPINKNGKTDRKTILTLVLCPADATT